jgi:SAM-dependent methyltransferase
MTRYFTNRELDRLRVLREGFLWYEGRTCGPGVEPYWDSAEELALYDKTFAQRIGWKWDAVLLELTRRQRWPATKRVLDWGCGSGVAARRVLAARSDVRTVWLWDHSEPAREFAAERVRAEFPKVEVHVGVPEGPIDALLLSHVFDELDEETLAAVLALVERAGATLWVEPGSRRTSRRLGEVRERLRATLDVLAPCPHQAACGALSGGDAWCHAFARPANEVYTEGKWAEFGRELGIDLRSLPYSFLVVAQRGAVALESGPNARLLGRPRLTRGRAELELCRAEGVATVDFLQRTDKALFKALDDVPGVPWLFDAAVEGRRITALARRDA